MCYLTNFLFYHIPLLYYYINLRSSVICCLFAGDICLSFDISMSSRIFFGSFVTVSKLFFGEVSENFVI